MFRTFLFSSLFAFVASLGIATAAHATPLVTIFGDFAPKNAQSHPLGVGTTRGNFVTYILARPFTVMASQPAQLKALSATLIVPKGSIFNASQFQVWYWNSPWLSEFRMHTNVFKLQGSGIPVPTARNPLVVVPDRKVACASIAYGTLFARDATHDVIKFRCNLNDPTFIVSDGAISLAPDLIKQGNEAPFPMSILMADRGTGYSVTPINNPNERSDFGVDEVSAPIYNLEGQLVN